jgi:transcriptional regulator NrdR family protein
MQCVNCKYPDSCVVKTTHDDNSNMIVRRRECLRCGHRYTTQEEQRVKVHKTSPPHKILPA